MVNFDYEELKRKALETAGLIADKSKEIAKKVADKSVMIGKIAKLSAEIATEKDKLKRAYIELGKYYYEHMDEPGEGTEETVKTIDTALENIEVKKVAIDELKAAVKDFDGTDVTVEDVVYEEVKDDENEAEPETEEAEKKPEEAPAEESEDPAPAAEAAEPEESKDETAE